MIFSLLKSFRSGFKSRCVSVPTVLQLEAVECGAASLAMILAHYGRYVALIELRHVCGVSRDGSKASNILKAARHYGLDASGSRKSITALYNSKQPSIIYWDFCHYVVLEGFNHRKKIVYLNDPAEGRRKVTFEDFSKSYTGIELSMSPNSNFTKSAKPPGILASLHERIRGSALALTYVLLTSILLAVMGILVPAFSKTFVDEVLVNSSRHMLPPLLYAMAITTGIQLSLMWLQQYCLLRLETKLAVASSSRYLWHLLRLPLSFYSQRLSGDVGCRLSLADRLAQLLSRDLASAALSLTNILFFVVVMAFYDLSLTLIGLTLNTLSIVAVVMNSRFRTDANKRLQNEAGKAVGVAIGGVQIIESLKASGAEEDFFARWSGQQVKSANARQSLGLTLNVVETLAPFLSTITTVAIIGIGSLRVMNGDMSAGMLVAFQALMTGISGPINRIVQLAGKVQDASGDIYRLDDVLQSPTDPLLEDNPTQISDGSLSDVSRASFPGTVEIKGLTFGYSPLDPPLVADFNLRLEPGRRVALVGSSGSGKSTIAKILAGTQTSWSGEVLFNGKSREQYSRHLLSNVISMVDQEISMFTGSLRDNLTMWDRTIDPATIVEAAKDAEIHDVIASRPGGYESIIQGRGGEFSGGQLQRLEIARALVTKPSVLILDEATSALDPITEQKVSDNIRKRGCTCVIVAHRLSTIRDCDEIIVLEHGKVAERGTHEELVAKQGSYFELIRAA